MTRNVLWWADESSYEVNVRHGIRVVHRFQSEALGDSPVESRMQAVAKAVELALEHRITLAEVREAGEPL